MAEAEARRILILENEILLAMQLKDLLTPASSMTGQPGLHVGHQRG
ncbi:hypothetical protein N183_34650 [Sinorhizobium sp. Sb3]|nr:hypothetical protein N183_34650 [Sinorhizobium sp. Sb3]